MKELVRLHIPHTDDRSDLVAILATAGYIVTVDIVPAARYSLDSPSCYVVVYEKETKS